MKVAIYTHPEFDRQIKHYKKKYHSLLSDYRYFLTSLKQNPFQGSSLGRGIRKVRFGVADKGGGKSGGMRVITFTVNKIDDEILLNKNYENALSMLKILEKKRKEKKLYKA